MDACGTIRGLMPTGAKADDESVVALGERSWLPRHVRGDAAAFPALLAAYRRPIYGYLARAGIDEAERDDLVRQANWQKVGGASPPERRSNRTTFLREPCVGSREGAGEASVAAWMGRAIVHRKSDGPGC